MSVNAKGREEIISTVQFTTNDVTENEQEPVISVVDDYLDNKLKQKEYQEEGSTIDLERQTDHERIAYQIAKNGINSNTALLEILRKKQLEMSERETENECEIGSDFIFCDLDTEYGI